MPFTTANRIDLVNRLNLQKDQAKSTSVLAQLMTRAETFDTDHGTTYVTEIQSALVELLALESSIQTAAASDGFDRIEIFQSYEVEQKPGANTAHLLSQRQGHINTIKKLLDPDNYLDRYCLSGRVIRAL
jgi:hypothetical protein